MIMPRECPSASVLRMHIIPSGPIGTAIANPIISPFRKKIGSMLSSSDQLVAVDTVGIGVTISLKILIDTISVNKLRCAERFRNVKSIGIRINHDDLGGKTEKYHLPL
jgi:hypothetical protein